MPYESEYLRRDGRRVAVLVSGYPLPGGDESVEFTLDITDRKAAEAALSESEQRFRAVFEEALVGIALTDLRTGRFIEANERYAAIIGLTRDALTAVSWMSVTHPDDLGPDLVNLVQLMDGDIPGYRMEKRYLRPDGADRLGGHVGPGASRGRPGATARADDCRGHHGPQGVRGGAA